MWKHVIQDLKSKENVGAIILGKRMRLDGQNDKVHKINGEKIKYHMVIIVS